MSGGLPMDSVITEYLLKIAFQVIILLCGYHLTRAILQDAARDSPFIGAIGKVLVGISVWLWCGYHVTKVALL